MQWAPPVMEISDQEMMWLEEDESAVCLLWDSNSRYEQYIRTELRAYSYHIHLIDLILKLIMVLMYGSKIESSKEQMMELMASALAAPLNPKQQQQLAAKIREDSNFILQYNITPNNVCMYYVRIRIYNQCI